MRIRIAQIIATIILSFFLMMFNSIIHFYLQDPPTKWVVIAINFVAWALANAWMYDISIPIGD